MTARQLSAIVLTVLMVLSVVAAGSAGAVSTESTPADLDVAGNLDPSGSTAADVPGQNTHDQPGTNEANSSTASDDATSGSVSTYVDPAFSDLEDETQVLIKLEGAAPDSSVSAEAAADQFKSHAEQTQGPVLDALGTVDEVEVKNTYWITNVIVADLEPTRDVLDRVSDIDGVEAVFKSREVEPPEPVETESVDVSDTNASPSDVNATYGLEQINATDVWADLGVRGAGATVAVLDTGVDPSHPDIDLHTDDPSDPTYPGGYAAWDAQGGQIEGLEPESGPPSDPGHGDHTSATATGGDASGTAIGVAPEANLIHGDVFQDPNGTDATVIAGIQWAVENDADVTSMSLGFGCTGLPPEPAYIQSLLDPVQNAKDSGTAMSVSTGNAGEGCVGTPGSQYDSLGIGATNAQQDVTLFSSGGQIQSNNWDSPPAHWPDSYVKPDVVAPGDSVLSAGPNGDGYAELSGTSMAAPHAAGAIALIRSFNPDATVEEIETAFTETAQKPDSWVGPRDERDPRYGMGILDVRAAISEIDAEITLGDIAADDSVDLDDVMSIERAAAGLEPDGLFLPNRADLDRDGEVSLSDSILAQRLATGSLEPASLNVSDFSGPTEIDGSQTVEMTATIENSDAMGALRYVEFRLGESAELGNESAIDRQFLDISGANVDDPRSNGPVTDVTFELNTSELSGQDYNVGIFSDTDSNESLVTVRKPEFSVTDVSTSDEVDLGETISVDVEIENTGNDIGEKNLSYELANSIGDTTASAVERNLELAAGQTETVTFEIDTSDFQGGEFTQTLSTPDDEQSVDLSINEANLDVAEIDAPSQLFANESEYTVNATIQNNGDAPEEQTVNYAPTDLDVAVVDVNHADAPGPELVDKLSDDPRYDAELMYASAIPDAMDDYDAFVVQQFGSNETADRFLNNLKNQGVVYLDSYQGSTNGVWSDGVYHLSQVRENPDTHREVSTQSDGDAAELSIEAEHPIFADVGDVGEDVEMYNDTSSDNTWGSWFDGYDGEQLASIDYGNGYSGPSVAVNEPRDEVLMTAAGRSGYTEPGSFTEASNQLLDNAVEYVLTGDVSTDRLSPVATDASAAVDSKTVDLAPGESTQVSFEHALPSDHPTGDSLHAVWTEDSVAGADVSVLEDDYFEIADVDAPETANQTETITVSATVQNDGSSSGTQDVEFAFNGSVVDTKEDVSLDAGNSTTLDFEYTIDDYQEPDETLFAVRSGMGEHEGVIDVLEIEDANFDVTVTDATETVGQFENVTVNATVENVGDRTATQSLAYEYTPSLNVAVVDNDPSTHGVDAMATDLDDRFGEQVSVETLNASDLDAEMANYDVFVVNHFGEADVGAFLDSLDDDQGTIYLDSWEHGQSNGINALSSERLDPGEVQTEWDLGAPTFYDITTDHPLFEGLGSVGDSITIGEDTAHRTWFDNYGGNALADIRVDATTEGSAVGVNDDENELLLGSMGLTEYATWSQYDENASVILDNAIEHIGIQLVSDGSAGLTTDPIQLEGGENASVTFETEIPLTATSGEYFHVVESDNDAANSKFTVDEEVTAVRGTVTDEAGDPIAGATVSISGDESDEVETDANGEYFVELEPGDYVVDANADGYQTNDIVSLAEGDVVTVDHTLAAVAGDITGTVTDEGGDPVEGATVTDADGNAFDVETDANGDYTIEDVAAGTYALEASAVGYATTDIAFVEHSADSPGSQDFELAAPESISLSLDDSSPANGTETEAAVTAHFANASPTEVTDDAQIESDNASVATVADATVSAESEGSTQLTATYMGFTNSTDLTVDSAALESIEVTLNESTVYVDNETTATVTGHYTDGSQSDVTGDATISSADTDLATVTDATVTGAAEGEVAIEADYENETASTTLLVDTVGTDIAVVDNDPSTHGVEDAAAAIDSRLEGDEPVTVETLQAEHLLGNMTTYDAFVVNHFGSADVNAFLDELRDDQGTVYLDTSGEASNGVESLSTARNDPQSVTDDSGAGAGELYYEVTTDNVLFDNIAEQGEDFTIAEGPYEFPYFEDYSGSALADVGYGPGASGPSVGMNESANEVLLSASGLSDAAVWDAYTADGLTLLANSVAHVSDAESLDQEVENLSVELDDSEILDEDPDASDNETAATVMASFNYGQDGDVTDTATLTSTNETVATVADNGTILGHAAGETTITAEYQDENATANLSVIESAEVSVEIDETNAPITEGEPLEVNATVENVGDEEASSRDIELLDFEDSSVAETSVDLQGGENETVTLTWATGADAGTDNVTVQSDDHEATTEVTIEEQSGDANVAVVDDDPSTHGVDDMVVDINNQLEGNFAETVATENLLGNVSEYDTIVVNAFGSANVSDFLNELGSDQGVVYLDQAYGDSANGIAELASVRDGLGSLGEESFGVSAEYNITADHPLFDGLGTVGDTITVTDSGNYVYFESYGGETIATAEDNSDRYGVGVDDNRSEVLLPANGINSENVYADYTTDGLAVLTNAVEYVNGSTTEQAAAATDANAAVPAVAGE